MQLCAAVRSELQASGAVRRDAFAAQLGRSVEAGVLAIPLGDME
jgi:hypothetical protein